MGGGKSVKNPSSDKLAGIAEDVNADIKPAREEFTSQLMEAMTTGGVGARIPIIQRMVESSRKAGSDALKGTEESLASAGLVGTPFGQSTLATQRGKGEFDVNQAAASIIQQLLQVAPNYIMGQGTQAVQGMGSASDAMARQYSANQGAMASIFDSMAKLGVGIGGLL